MLVFPGAGACLKIEMKTGLPRGGRAVDFDMKCTTSTQAQDTVCYTMPAVFK